MHDIEMNLHNDLEDNHDQLEHLNLVFTHTHTYIYIYILVTHKEIFKFTAHLPSSSHKSII
jgi:hypothetical protein